MKGRFERSGDNLRRFRKGDYLNTAEMKELKQTMIQVIKFLKKTGDDLVSFALYYECSTIARIIEDRRRDQST